MDNVEQVMICEQCQGEYLPHIKICPKCEVTLVLDSQLEESQSEDSPHNEIVNNPVMVGAFFWIHEAETAKVQLATAGIESYIENGGITGADPLLANAAGGIQLFVSPEDASQAYQILNPPEEEIKRQCPKCESEDIHYHKVTIWMLLLCITILGFWFIAVYKPYQCNSCQYKWR